MIVLCNKIISATTKQDLGDHKEHRKKGKQYIVLALRLGLERGISVYLRANLYSSPIWFSADGFEFISNIIPSSWVKEITAYYGKKTISMLPSSWNYESFWEDLDDGKPAAWNLFETETIQMYKEEGWLNVNGN